MPIHAPERGIDIPLDKSNIARNADKMMAGMMKLLHPRAAQVLAPHLNRDLRTQAEFERPVSPEEKAVFDNVRNWLIARLEQLELEALDNGRLVLNPWNQTNHFGLQSVSVGVNRLVKGDEHLQSGPVLLPGEWKHPTIGVIAKGMLDSRFRDVTGLPAQFPIDAGKQEELTSMSDGFSVVGAAGHWRSSLNAGEKKVFAGPDAVKLYIERPVDPNSEFVGTSVQEAVYACVFKNSDIGGVR